ncbi:MAG TPA: hypothetical protein VMX17_14050 [Candidatus Glassbacteria bacterium]|nr:hypothetical protein [Candidatus Glassbacteria bacterium]
MSSKVTKSTQPIDKKIVDDVGLEENTQEPVQEEPEVDLSKLEALRAKMKKQQSPKEEVAEEEVEEAEENQESKPEVLRSLKFGVVGLGQCGARVAESFFLLGYDVIVANTATQDLVHINVPEDNKLFMDIGLQGAAKNTDRGQEAAEQYREEIQKLYFKELGDCEVIILASSCGGGTGAGGLPTVIEILQETGKPIVVIAVLPMVSEDVKTKGNTIDTISILANLVNDNKIQSLITVDNAKIESIYSGVNQMEFYKVANQAIVEPIDVFNTFSMKPSDVKPIDSSEWASLLLNGQGLSIYGQMSLTNYEEDTSIAEAVVESLSDNLLAGSFDLTQANNVGFIVIANENVWKNIPAGSINYASLMLADVFNEPEGTFKGIYSDESISDGVVKIYTFVSGLSLPAVRMKELQEEVEAQKANAMTKNKKRSEKLNMDLNKNTATSQVDKIKQKVANKMSGFGKLTSGKGVVDRRKR